jgi:hypothetical protein
MELRESGCLVTFSVWRVIYRLRIENVSWKHPFVVLCEPWLCVEGLTFRVYLQLVELSIVMLWMWGQKRIIGLAFLAWRMVFTSSLKGCLIIVKHTLVVPCEPWWCVVECSNSSESFLVGFLAGWEAFWSGVTVSDHWKDFSDQWLETNGTSSWVNLDLSFKSFLWVRTKKLLWSGRWTRVVCYYWSCPLIK